MKKVGFHRLAKAEFIESAKWYESQQPGLGIEFRQEVEAAIARICVNPEGFGFIESDKRLHRVHRFPYGVAYQVLPKEIFILAVMHLQRDPDYWKSRE
jgi:plasmid stabilization system protein ParE